MAEEFREDDKTEDNDSGNSVAVQLPQRRLELSNISTREEWITIGKRLVHSIDSSRWALVDWWLHGEARSYGELRSTVEALQEHGGPAYQTWANALSVGRAFPVSRRRENLSFSHHEVVASLEEKDQEYFLTWAEENEASVAKLRSQIEETRISQPGRPEQKITRRRRQSSGKKPSTVKSPLQKIVNKISRASTSWQKEVGEVLQEELPDDDRKAAVHEIDHSIEILQALRDDLRG